MKKRSLLLALLLLVVHSSSWAHNMWIETAPAGMVGQQHQVHIYYGEYTYDYYETMDEGFADVSEFDLWVVYPDGEKQQLTPQPDGNRRYSASFTPKNKGTYAIVASSTKAPVVDWREYEMGVLKPHFYATATVAVGKATDAPALDTPLTIQRLDGPSGADVTGDSIEVAVHYKGEPLAEQELMVSVADQWTRTISTNEEGHATMRLPWRSLYILETVYRQEKPGSYNGDKYEAVRHVATLSVDVEQ